MFKIHWNKKNTTEAIYVCAVLAIALTGISLVVHIRIVYAALHTFLRVISPIVYGLSLAYVINPLLNLIEGRVISPLKPKKIRFTPALRRVLSLIISYVIVAAFLFLIGLLIFPQIVGNYEVIVDRTSDFFQDMISRIGDTFGIDSEELSARVGEQAAKYLSRLGTFGAKFALGFLMFLVGFIISFFVLLHKEHLQASVKKLLASFLKPKRFNSMMRVAGLADKTFGRFFIGKIFDSLIIGVISFVVFWIFRMPYYPLLAAVICITNIIPYFGPIIGAIPCVILVLTESPVKAFWIAVIILIIQQIDGNIIGPKIVGNAIGIKSLWVVISITILGSFFGFVGMLIGAPLFSVLYTIVKEHTEKRLKKRDLPTETVAYADKNPLTVFEDSVGLTPEEFVSEMKATLPEVQAEEDQGEKSEQDVRFDEVPIMSAAITSDAVRSTEENAVEPSDENTVPATRENAVTDERAETEEDTTDVDSVPSGGSAEKPFEDTPEETTEGSPEEGRTETSEAEGDAPSEDLFVFDDVSVCGDAPSVDESPVAADDEPTASFTETEPAKKRDNEAQTNADLSDPEPGSLPPETETEGGK